MFTVVACAVVALFAALLPIAGGGVNAAPRVAISPDRGQCGEAVALHGEEFRPGNHVTLRGPSSAATGRRPPEYRELKTTVGADGRWLLETPFCLPSDRNWALVDGSDPACLAPSAPCSEFVFALSVVPDPAAPPAPGSDYAQRLLVRTSNTDLPGLPNTGGGAAHPRTSAPAAALVGALISAMVLLGRRRTNDHQGS